MSIITPTSAESTPLEKQRQEIRWALDNWDAPNNAFRQRLKAAMEEVGADPVIQQMYMDAEESQKITAADLAFYINTRG